MSDPNAAVLAEHITVIARLLRRSVQVQAQPAPVALTPPQAHAMETLVSAERDGVALSLSELSARMGLAHSTVSGIVARLEQRGVLHRSTFPQDRRQTRIQLSDNVRNWLTGELPRLRQQPLNDALDLMSHKQVVTLRDGLALLRTHLEAQRRRSSDANPLLSRSG